MGEPTQSAIDPAAFVIGAEAPVHYSELGDLTSSQERDNTPSPAKNLNTIRTAADFATAEGMVKKKYMATDKR